MKIIIFYFYHRPLDTQVLENCPKLFPQRPLDTRVLENCPNFFVHRRPLDTWVFGNCPKLFYHRPIDTRVEAIFFILEKSHKNCSNFLFTTGPLTLMFLKILAIFFLIFSPTGPLTLELRLEAMVIMSASPTARPYHRFSNLTPRIPNSCSCCCSCSVTKSIKWRYLGNQAWYHRSAGVKTTGKNSE